MYRTLMLNDVDVGDVAFGKVNLLRAYRGYLLWTLQHRLFNELKTAASGMQSYTGIS